MGDQTTFGPNAEASAQGSATARVSDQERNVVAGNGGGQQHVETIADQTATNNGVIRNGDNGGFSKKGGAVNLVGESHPVPDNLNIIGNGMIQANNDAGRGGTGDSGEGDDLAGEVGNTDEIVGRGPIDTACSEGPSSLVGMVGPPSPLTGCYLLIILGEPQSEEHKDHILQNLYKGFLSWDVSDCHVDLQDELETITQHAPEGEEARHGERLIQYASENLVTEVLIHPQYNTLIQCMRNLLSSFTRHRHIIHAGYTFCGNGSWILQDGTFSVADFSEAFQEHDVQRVLRAYPDTITMNIHCADNGLWNTLPDKSFARLCKIRINPNDVLDTGNESINAFIDYLAPMLVPASLKELLETSDVVGNIRFTHPTLYVFPGGQGDAALFGINGFNMLVDGGFNRKACFWDFVRHLDRLDAVLLTRLNNTNINGMAAVVERKRESHVYPHIGHFFCNIPDNRGLPSPDGDKDKDPLLVDLFERGHTLVSDLKSLDLKPQTCYRNSEPINLYHKVGHGTLDMYVISPAKDSKEVKDFLHKWNSGDQRLFAARDTREFNFPLQNLVSICALLVWQPANPDDTITRILFPGSTPDYKIHEGLEKLKHLEFMKYSTCTAKSIAPVVQTITTRRVFKSGPTEKVIAEPVLPSKVGKSLQLERDTNVIESRIKTTVQQQQDNKIKETTVETIEKRIEKLMDKEGGLSPAEIIEQVAQESEQEQESKEEEKLYEEDNKEITEKKVEVMIVKPQLQQPTELITKEEIPEIIKAKPKLKAEKPRAEVKPVIRSRIDTKPPKSLEKKTIKKEDRKGSPTPGPRRQEITTKTHVTKEKEIKSKISSRVAKSSPNNTPAKSAKDANNRKVLESKQQISKVSTSRREMSRITTTTEKKDAKKPERKPISRRPRGTSPSKRAPGSPVKVPKPKADLKKSRLDKGGTTDSSLVSTPSADDVTTTKKIQEMVMSQEFDAAKQRELDDLKEEQEVVREIEAVFSRDERKRQSELKADHREIAKQDSTTEAEEDEEYLIIEKEEIEQYTEDSIIEQESSITKEEEIQKHQRDSQESEKKRKKSAEEEIEAEIAKTEAEKRRNRQAQEAEEEEEGDMQPDSIEEKAKLTTPEKIELKAEVQEIISSAKEIVKARAEETTVKTEELSSPTPEDKISSAKKTSDTKDEPVEDQDAGKYINLQESLPEEKFSATIESGATTAPTLPEDERIPLDEIKEDLVIEEKHVREETKEAEPAMPASKTATAEVVKTTAERVLPLKMTFETQQSLLRDVVKTPDEVADLPVHEEADFGDYEEKDTHAAKPLSLKEEIAKEEKEVEEEKDVPKEKSAPAKPKKADQDLFQKPIDILSSRTANETEECKESHIISKHELLTRKKQPIQIESNKSTEKSEFKETDTLLTNKATILTKENEVSLGMEVSSEPFDLKKKTSQKKSVTSPDEKDLSEMTSEDELPEQLPAIKGKISEIRDKEDTSLESPATIEEAIEVEIEKAVLSKKTSDVNKIKEEISGKSLLEELQTQSIQFEKLKAAEDARTKLKRISDEEEDEKSSIKNLSPKSSQKEETILPPDNIDEKLTAKQESPAFKDMDEEQYLDESTSFTNDEKDSGLTEGKGPCPAAKQKDEISPSASKEDSRIESVAIHFDEKERLDDSKTALKEDQEPKTTVSKELSPAVSQKDDISAPVSKQISGPVSVASHFDKKEPLDDKTALKEDKDQRKTEKKDDKFSQASKEFSRPDSVESQVDEKVQLEERKTSIHAEPESPGTNQKDEKFSSESKVVSHVRHVGGKEQLGEVITSIIDKPETVTTVSKAPSPAESLKDEKSPPVSEQVSRPHSVASHFDEKEFIDDGKIRLKEDQEPCKTESTRPSLDAKEFIDDGKICFKEDQDVKSPLESTEVSRPDLIASQVNVTEHMDESEASFRDRAEQGATVSKEPPFTASKELSRPDSVASHVDEKEQLDDGKMMEKPESGTTVSKAPSPAESQKDEIFPQASKEVSRPEPVASYIDKKQHLNEDKSFIKDETESVTIKSKITSPATSQKDEKSPPEPKEVSRPDSVSSDVDEKEQLVDGKMMEKPESGTTVSKAPSPTESQKDEISPQASKEVSQPDSATSHVDEKEQLDDIKMMEKPESGTTVSKAPSPAESQKDEISPQASKEVSRPESVASSIDKKQHLNEDKSFIKDETESVTIKSKTTSPATSQKDEKSPPESKEVSRPDSVSSDVDEKEQLVDAKMMEKPESGTTVSKAPSPTESQKDEISPQASKEVSRPESVASYIDKKQHLDEDKRFIKDETESVTIESKTTSPAASQKEGKSSPEQLDDIKMIKKSESGTTVSKAPSPAESQKDEKSPQASKEVSRPASAASQVEEKEHLDKSQADVKEESESVIIESKAHSPAISQKDEASPQVSKELSRPESVASSIDEKQHLDEGKSFIKDEPQPTESKTPSPATSQKDEKSPPVSKDVSRPDSVASHTDEKEQLDEGKTSIKERPASGATVSEAPSPAGSQKGEISAQASKEVSQPESVASSIDEKQHLDAGKSFIKDEPGSTESKAPSPATSQKDEKSPSASKEASRSDSVASHVDEKEQLDDGKRSVKEKRESGTEASIAPSPADSQNGEISPQASKEVSRPESVASSIDEKQHLDEVKSFIQYEPGSTESKTPSPATSQKDEKSPSASKEVSRPDSVASRVDEKEQLDVGKTSIKEKPESGTAVSKLPSPAESQKDDISPQASKELSRPESVATSIDETSIKEKPESGTAVSKVPSPAESQKDDISPQASKELSRPESVATSIDKKQHLDEGKSSIKDEPGSTESITPTSATSQKDEKSPSASKEVSRPESVASHVDEKEQLDDGKPSIKEKPESGTTVSKVPSPAESQKDDISPQASKEVPRPESVASSIDEKQHLDESKSFIKDEPESTESKTPSPATSQKDDKSPSASKEASRPDSVVSHVGEKKHLDDGKTSIKEKLESETTSSNVPSPAESQKDEISPQASKEVSRPESVASSIDEKQHLDEGKSSIKDEPGSTESKTPTQTTNQRGEKSPSASKEVSRPDSVASHVDEKEQLDDIKPSIKDDISPQASKEVSRPDSVASHADEKEQMGDNKRSVKEKPESGTATSKTPSPAESQKDEISPQASKEVSRPESVASSIDEKQHLDEGKSFIEDEPGPTESETPTPATSQKKEKSPSASKEVSRPDSVASHVDEKEQLDDIKPSIKDDISPQASKEVSRPDSVASHADEKEQMGDNKRSVKEKPESGTATSKTPSPAESQKDEISPQASKEVSRPESVASSLEEKQHLDQSKSFIEDEPGPTKSETPTPATSQKKEKSPSASKEVSRPDSVASHVDEKEHIDDGKTSIKGKLESETTSSKLPSPAESQKDEISPQPSKEVSRPELAASSIDEKQHLDEGKRFIKDKPESTESKAPSPAISQKDEKSPSASKEVSRPDSVVSHVDEKEQFNDGKPSAKETPESETTASKAPSLTESQKDKKSPQPSKEVSRPESVASSIDEKQHLDESKSFIQYEPGSTESKTPSPVTSQKDEKSPSASKEASRPDSVVSHIDEKEQLDEGKTSIKIKPESETTSSKLPSPAESQKDEISPQPSKEVSRPESVASSIDEKQHLDESKSFIQYEPGSTESKTPSPVTSQKDEKSPSASKEASRPDSVVSHIDEKEQLDEGKTSIKIKPESETTSSKVLSPAESQKDEISPQASKEVSRPESVASSIDEKQHLDEGKSFSKDEPGSTESKTPTPAISQKDKISPSASKEVSRPDSVVSHVDEKEHLDDGKPSTKEKPESWTTASKAPSPAESQKDKKSPQASKNLSQSESVATSIDEKQHLDEGKSFIKDEPESTESKAPSPATSQKDEKSPSASKEASRSDSVASHVDEKEQLDEGKTSIIKPESGTTSSTVPSPAESQKDEISPQAFKEVSRPESVASSIDEKQHFDEGQSFIKNEPESTESKAPSPAASQKDEKLPSASKEVSRPDSVASHVDEKKQLDEDKTSVKEKPESGATTESQKDEITQSASKEVSRPESVASNIDEKQHLDEDKSFITDEKEPVTTESKAPSPATSLESEISPPVSTEVSRPDSVASHVDEKEHKVEAQTSFKEKPASGAIVTKAPSKTESQKGEISPPVSKEVSRPDSVASSIDEKQHLDEGKSFIKDEAQSTESKTPSPATSQKDEKSPSASKEVSRPDSVASRVDEKEQLDVGKTSIKEKPESGTAVGEAPSPTESQKGEISAQASKEVSRRESVASSIDEKQHLDEGKSFSKDEPGSTESKTPTPATSQKDEKSPSASTEVSRPDSVASHFDEKEQLDDGKRSVKEKPESGTAASKAPSPAESQKVEKSSSESKEVSRPDSVASHIDEMQHLDERKSSIKNEIKSVTTETPSPVTSQQDEKSPPVSKDVSRPDSVASHIDEKEQLDEDKTSIKERPASGATVSEAPSPTESQKGEISAQASKEVSRPQSVASSIDEKQHLDEGKSFSKDEPGSTESKTPTPATNQKDEKSPSASTEVSRLDSVASHVDEKEQLDDGKRSVKEKPESGTAASKAPSPAESQKDEIFPQAFKEVSRPESVASSIDEKQHLDEVKSFIKYEPGSTESKTPTPATSQKDEKSPSASTEVSRPDSVASHVDEKEQLDDGKRSVKEKPESGTAASKAPSPAESQKVEKSSSESKEVSRPDSVASHIDEMQHLDERKSSIKNDIESVTTETPSPVTSQKDKKSPPASKEVSRPDSVASLIDEKEHLDESKASLTERSASRVKVSETPSPAESQTGEKSPPAFRGASRRESRASSIDEKQHLDEGKNLTKVEPEPTETKTPSPATSQKDEKSPSASKEVSRPCSVISHTDEEEHIDGGKTSSKTEPESGATASKAPSPVEGHVVEKPPSESKEVSRPDYVEEKEHLEESKASVKEELELGVTLSKAPSPDATQKNEISPSGSMETSRPDSVASSTGKKQILNDDKSFIKDEPESAESKALSPATSQKYEKSLSASKEVSRPDSVASHADEKEHKDEVKTLMKKEPESGERGSYSPSPHRSQKDEKSSAVSKDDEGKTSVKEKPESETTVSKTTSPAESQKDEISLPASKEVSRPDSVASLVDEKEHFNEGKSSIKERPALGATVSEAPSLAESQRDKKSPPAFKEVSRPESVASSIDKKQHLGEGKSFLKDEPESTGNKAFSPTSSHKDQKSPPASKEVSRPDWMDEKSPPASVVDHVDDSEHFDEGKTSIKEKPEPQTTVSKAHSPAESQKDEISLLSSKEVSRPDSVASHVDEKEHFDEGKTSIKERSALRAIVSEAASPAVDQKGEKSPSTSKEISRPHPVARHVDEKELLDGSKASLKEEPQSGATLSKAPSPATSQKDEKSSPASTEVPRPHSVTSHVDKIEHGSEYGVAVSKSPSPVATQKGEKPAQASKEVSRPHSVASHVDDEDHLDEENTFIMEEPKSGAAGSKAPSPAASQKGEKSTPESVEVSRPHSVSSHIDEKELLDQRKTPIEDETESGVTIKKAPSTAASQKDEKSPPESKEVSRPDSVASSIDEKQPLDQGKSFTKDETQSVTMESKAPSPDTSLKDEKSPPASKEVSRPDSVASLLKEKEHTDEGENAARLKDEKSSPVPREVSQPDLGISHVDKKEHMDKSKTVKQEQVAIVSKETSPDASQKVEKSAPVSEEVSRLDAIATSLHEKTQLYENIQAVSEKVEWQIGSEKVSPSSLPIKKEDFCKDRVLVQEKESQEIKTHEKMITTEILSATTSLIDKLKKDITYKESFTDSTPIDQSKFPVVSETQRFPTPLQKCTTAEKFSTDDTVSSPIDKAPSSLSSAELENTLKPDKESFKLDLQQAKPAESKLGTASSPVDIAHCDVVSSDFRNGFDHTQKRISPNVAEVKKPAEKAKVQKETVSSPIDEVVAALEIKEELRTADVIGEIVHSLKSDISQEVAKATEITSSISDDLKQMALKVETFAEDSATTIKKEIIPLSEKVQTVTEQIDKTSETIETVKVSYDIKSFHTELRETHITTVDSPARDEIILHDIKEEDEEHKQSPPKETAVDKSPILPPVQLQRPVSPREEEVAKIVANVAQVLKSEKDLTEIIPDFDEKELEEKLFKTHDDDSSTVQRMLVTASSEDGGEEIEICPKGSILFTPGSTPDTISGKVLPDGSHDTKSDVKSTEKSVKKVSKSSTESEKTSPDLKSGPLSLEEKDRVEISEKLQIEKEVNTLADRKESSSSINEYHTEFRRESAVSTLSEKDLTRDESTYDEGNDSATSHDFDRSSPEKSDQTQEPAKTFSHKEDYKVYKGETVENQMETAKYTQQQIITKSVESNIISNEIVHECSEKVIDKVTTTIDISAITTGSSNLCKDFSSKLDTLSETDISEQTATKVSKTTKVSTTGKNEYETLSLGSDKVFETAKFLKEERKSTENQSRNKDDEAFKSIILTTNTAASSEAKKIAEELASSVEQTSLEETQHLSQDAFPFTTVSMTTRTITTGSTGQNGEDKIESQQIYSTTELIGDQLVEDKEVSKATSGPQQETTEFSEKGSIPAKTIERDSFAQNVSFEKSVSSCKEDVSNILCLESRLSHTEMKSTSTEKKEDTLEHISKNKKNLNLSDISISSEIKEAVIVKTEGACGSEKKSSTKQVSTEILTSASVQSKSKAQENDQISSTITSTVTSKKTETNDGRPETTQYDKVDSRRELTPSQSSEGRQTLSDQEEDDVNNIEILKIKESRSKSIATIMMTSIYKPSEECMAMDALDEEESTEIQLHESTRLVKPMDQFETDKQITTTQESQSRKDKKSDAMFSSSLIDEKSPDEHIDRKTPPTAPVSPGIKSTSTTEQREGLQNTSVSTMQYSEIYGASVPSSPKDFSGKSSPGALTSDSRSIPTPAGRESLTETPESSPKPTSPFPRVAKEDIQTTTTFGATEVARSSTPELSQIKALEKTPLSASHEKIITTTITTVTKVISSDGKEIVTEEKTITTTDTSEPDGEKVTVTTTRTTSESDKVPQPKELAILRSEYRSSTPASDDDRPYSDDEIPHSPRSVTSSQAASYDLQRSSSGISKRSDIDIDDSQDDIPPQYGSEEHSSAISISMAHKVIDPMSTSFYGALPDTFGPITTSITNADKSEPIPIRTSRTIVSRTYTESPSQSSESESASQTWAIRHVGDHKFLDEADLDFEKALEEHRQVRGADVMSSVTSKYAYSPSKSSVEEIIAKPTFPLGDIQKSKGAEGASSTPEESAKKDPTEAKAKDPLKEWGKPLGLPSPAPVTTEHEVRTTPKKERRIVAAKTKLNNEKNLRKRSESPSKTKKSSPVYVDLTYVPHNGNSYYSHVEFFKRVRARYYVFSGTEPSREVYNALLEAKQTWEDKELEVTIIPTYDTDVLGYWVAENEELLAKYHIDLSPSASRCTINLQDHETSCSAYRLEF